MKIEMNNKTYNVDVLTMMGAPSRFGVDGYKVRGQLDEAQTALVGWVSDDGQVKHPQVRTQNLMRELYKKYLEVKAAEDTEVDVAG